MATKVSVFDDGVRKVDEKPIEFVYFLGSTGRRVRAVTSPGSIDNLCLLGKDDEGDFDLILAWHDLSKKRFIYLGHWNDGVINDD